MASLTSEQRRNAQIIIRVGRSLGASNRDLLIALMTALQESGLRNLSYGHLDSVGLFQQRAGWGSLAQRRNPAFSARMFFTGGVRGPGTPGLLDIRNRNSMRLTSAAQAVQRSAFPNAYAKHERTARAALGAGAGSARSTGSFIRPVRGGHVTSGFGPRHGSAGISRNHHGLDIGIPVGSPIYAAASGRVVRVTTGGNYGTRIEIAHEGKVWTLYAHLSGTNVRVGQQVMQGQLIGRSGGRRGARGAGNSTGPHLHFEVRTGSNAYHNARDPMGYLNGRSTPDAYLEHTTTVAADLSQFEEQMAEQRDLSKPYVYVSPVEIMSASMVPIAEPDPLARFGVGPPLPEPPSVAEVVGVEPEQQRELEGVLA